MRSLPLVLVVVLLIPSHLHAQDSRADGRVGFAVGLAINTVEGLTARVEYAPGGIQRPLSFRLEAGFRWMPTWRISRATVLYDADRFEGEGQSADIAVGLTAAVSPFPRGRFAPYVIGGVLAVQDWQRSQGFFMSSIAGVTQVEPPRSSTRGGVHLVGGLGLRARLFGESVRFEARHYHRTNAFTVGWGLHF
jgi:hypothetical protein